MRTFVTVVSLLGLLCSTGTANAATDRKETTKKTWSVDASHGTYGDSIPLEVPAFRGITPDLALRYDSSDDNGVAGVGWSLDGVGVIERASPGKGAPRYDATDIFLLNGKALVACAAGSPSPSCTTGGTHSTETESYERIELTGTGSASRWTVTAKDGIRRVFAPVLALNAGADVFRWGLAEVIDTKGNVVTYDWSADRLDAITYNGTTVAFHYESRSDHELEGIGLGTMRTVDARIRTIDVEVSGKRLRAYRLDYTQGRATGRSRLSSVQQFGRDAAIDGSGNVTGGTSLPAIAIEYQDGDPAFAEGSHDLAMANAANAQSFAIDIDGDGRTDLLELYPSLGITRRRTWISNGDGFTATSDDLGMSGGTNTRFLPMDVDGDGKTDVVEIYPNLVSWGVRTWISNGTGFDEASTDGAASLYSTDSHFLAMDIDGDGMTDMLELRPSWGSYRRVSWISTGDGFVEGADEAGIVYNQDSQFFGMDVNGDGMADLVEVFPGIGVWGRRVWFSHGSGFSAGATDSMEHSSDDEFIPMDINGDGMADLLQIHPFASVNYLRAWLSTGDAFTLASDDLGAPFSADNWYVAIDVNGDGKSDLVELDPYGLGLYRRQIWLSTGSGFVAGAHDVEMGFNPSTQLLAADVDGDGLSEMIELYPATIVTGRRVWRMSGGAYPDLLASITNSLGGTTEVEYAPSSSWENTNNPPLLQTATSVTVTDGRGGSATTRYAYAGGLHDRLHERFLGFRYREETLPCIAGESTCPSVETWFRQDYGAASKPERVDHRDGSGRMLRSEVYEYTTNGATVPWTSQQTGEWVYAYAGAGAECPGAECRRKYTSRTFDAYGEVTLEVDHGDYDAAGDEDTTSTIFVPNTTDYIVNKPADVKTFDGVGTDGDLLTETVTSYDDATTWERAPTAGLATKEARWLSSAGAFVETSKEYDGFGNLTAEVNAVGARTEFAFDSTYELFPTSATNALGQATTTTWDVVCGAPTQTTDVGGQPTTMTYDALCRMSEKIEPGGMFERHAWIDLGHPDRQYELIELPAADGTSEPRWTRIYFDGRRRIRPVDEKDTGGATGASNVLCEAPTQTNDGDGQPTAEAYDPQCRSGGTTSGDRFATHMIERSMAGGTTDPMGPRRDVDMQGRTWRTVTKGPDVATGDINVDIAHNAREQVASITAPYYWVSGAEQPRTYATTIDYDALDRETRVTLADGTHRTTSYGAWSETRTDALGHVETDHFDADHRRVAHEETVDGEVETVTYVYDARGHLAEVIDPHGNTITYSSDSLGRTTQMVDPDWGTWTLELDGADRLVAHTDAKGQRTTLAYDALDRRTEKTSLADTDAAVTVTWTYDEVRDGHHNVGRLTTMTDDAGDETLDHDAAGNVVKTVRTIEGDSYTFEHGFDAGGRPLWTTYPDGDTVGTPSSPLRYDGAGRLVAIPGYVDAARYDAQGRLVELRGANGVVTTRSYSPERGSLAAISTVSDAATIQDLAYERNENGAITEITSPFENEGWTFAYDELDRLVSATNTSDPTHDQTLEYDAIGNITWNSRFGEYLYETARPHAVTAAGSNGYEYDAAGLMISGGGRALTWDGDNRLASISHASAEARGPADDGDSSRGCGLAERRSTVWGWLVLVPLLCARRGRRRVSIAFALVAFALAVACSSGHGDEPADDASSDTDAPPSDDVDDEADATITFTYDGNGARIQQVEGSTTRRHLGDGYEIEVGGSTIKYVTIAGMVVARKEGDTKTWIHVDHLGSIQAATDASGVEVHRKTYRPYGEILSADGSLEYESRGYTGQRHDDSGLVYLHARYYDPALGRFISPDLVIDGPDTIGLNRYAYGHNDPIGNTDVDGQDADDEDQEDFAEQAAEAGAKTGAKSSWTILRESIKWVAPKAAKFIPGANLVVSGAIGIHHAVYEEREWAQEQRDAGWDPPSGGERVGYVALTAVGKTIDEATFGLARRLWQWGCESCKGD